MGFDRKAFHRENRKLIQDVKRLVAPAMDRASNLLADEIRSRCPVDKGALKASITVKKVRAARGRIVQDISIGAGLEHPEAAQVEYGTHDHAAVPFIRSSAMAREPEMIRILTSVFPES